MSKGYVYILSNPSMPGLVKIGKTTRDPSGRALELYQTGVPTPFTVEHTVFSPDCSEVERAVHARLDDFRVSPGREFFSASLDAATQELNNAHVEVVEAWLDEFLPCHIPAISEMVVDEGAVMCLANEAGVHPFDVVTAMGMATFEEVAPAISRWKARIAAMTAKRAAEQGAVH